MLLEILPGKLLARGIDASDQDRLARVRFKDTDLSTILPPRLRSAGPTKRDVDRFAVVIDSQVIPAFDVIEGSGHLGFLPRRMGGLLSDFRKWLTDIRAKES